MTPIAMNALPRRRRHAPSPGTAAAAGIDDEPISGRNRTRPRTPTYSAPGDVASAPVATAAPAYSQAAAGAGAPLVVPGGQTNAPNPVINQGRRLVIGPDQGLPRRGLVIGPAAPPAAAAPTVAASPVANARKRYVDARDKLFELERTTRFQDQYREPSIVAARKESEDARAAYEQAEAAGLPVAEQPAAAPVDAAPPSDDPMLHPLPRRAPKMSQPLTPKHAGNAAAFEADRQRMYENAPPGGAAGAGAGAAPGGQAQYTPEQLAIGAALPGATRIINRQTGGMASQLPETRLETARLMTSAGGRYPMQDTLEITDRLNDSDAMTASGMDPISYRRAQEVRAAQGQMKEAGVNARTLQGVGLGSAEDVPLSGRNYFGGPNGDGSMPAAAPKVIADEKAIGVPGAQVTQQDAIALMRRTQRNGVNTMTFDQAREQLVGERRKSAATSAALANAGKPADARTVLQGLLKSTDPAVQLKAATALAAMDKPADVSDERWKKIQGWAKIIDADTTRDLMGKETIGPDGKAAQAKLKKIMEDWDAEGAAAAPSPPAGATGKAMKDGKHVGWQTPGGIVDFGGNKIG